ncbi:hypothetical protein SapgrDRAFT_1113 [Saprospira grandis DSM 2844]|uniref:Uncharacterized protein n=1 Tax=Saprospira grandis DSM 2844 TaxID=694433 RepID=J1I3E2_9BACT|nr:hypothetical protein [Saprospira grandis]EJF52838.1 hypothetical protein SapgrDRAFT_1113 [Saprospira grandis DSM 2844]
MIFELSHKGPFEFNPETVKNEVEAGQMGNFALGKLDAADRFHPLKVGRSDTDLQRELLRWAHFPQYTHFSYQYAYTLKQAYELECKNFHTAVSQLNKRAVHPEPPAGHDFRCPNPWCNR